MYKSNLVKRLACAVEDTKNEYQSHIEDGFDITTSDSFSVQQNDNGDDIIGIISIECYEPNIEYRVQTICEIAVSVDSSVYHKVYVGLIDKDCTEFSYVGSSFNNWTSAVVGWYSAIKQQPLSVIQEKIDAVQAHTLPKINAIASIISNHLNKQALTLS